VVRGSAAVEWEKERWGAGGFVIGSSDHVFANRTFYLHDVVDGDQVELIDRRTALGADASYRRDRWRAGIEARFDTARVEVWHAVRRRRVEASSSDRIEVVDLAGHVEGDLDVTKRVRLLGGLRTDLLYLDETVVRPSPKIGALFHDGAIELRLDAGLGFRSTEGVPRTVAGELGMRVRPVDQLSFEAAVWGGGVEDERRAGLDAKSRLDLGWLALDAGLSVARSTEPLAPRLSGTGNAIVRRGDRFASLKVVGLGARGTSEIAEGHVVVGLAAGTKWRRFDIGLTVENVFDARWWEVQIVETYRLRDGEPTVGLLGTPGIPLTALVTLGLHRGDSARR
jgi:hypothetical protein